MAVAATQAGDTDYSQAPGLTSGVCECMVIMVLYCMYHNISA